jgi:hypothetical protein
VFVVCLKDVILSFGMFDYRWMFDKRPISDYLTTDC